MTYYGHSVLRTLIRCRFSPPDNTGQRYICTGDSTGRFIIYDLLTGKLVRKIKGHTDCVRDVSWHPLDYNLITSSWDGKITKWEYCATHDVTNEDELRPPLRRSERIVAQRRARTLNAMWGSLFPLFFSFEANITLFALLLRGEKNGKTGCIDNNLS